MVCISSKVNISSISFFTLLNQTSINYINLMILIVILFFNMYKWHRTKKTKNIFPKNKTKNIFMGFPKKIKKIKREYFHLLTQKRARHLYQMLNVMCRDTIYT